MYCLITSNAPLTVITPANTISNLLVLAQTHTHLQMHTHILNHATYAAMQPLRAYSINRALFGPLIET